MNTVTNTATRDVSVAMYCHQRGIEGEEFGEKYTWGTKEADSEEVRAAQVVNDLWRKNVGTAQMGGSSKEKSVRFIGVPTSLDISTHLRKQPKT